MDTKRITKEPRIKESNNMDLSLPPNVRTAIYIFVVLGTSIVVPLHVAHVVSDLVFNVWTSFSGAASLLAAFKVKK